jgi:hypothetical protein
MYTPLSMAGMNNASAEIAAADAAAYRDVRLFSVGQGTVSQEPLASLGTVYHNWTSASAAVLGGVRWKEFSAVCWLMGKEVRLPELPCCGARRPARRCACACTALVCVCAFAAGACAGSAHPFSLTWTVHRARFTIVCMCPSA